MAKRLNQGTRHPEEREMDKKSKTKDDSFKKISVSEESETEDEGKTKDESLKHTCMCENCPFPVKTSGISIKCSNCPNVYCRLCSVRKIHTLDERTRICTDRCTKGKTFLDCDGISCSYKVVTITGKTEKCFRCNSIYCLSCNNRRKTYSSIGKPKKRITLCHKCQIAITSIYQDDYSTFHEEDYVNYVNNLKGVSDEIKISNQMIDTSFIYINGDIEMFYPLLKELGGSFFKRQENWSIRASEENMQKLRYCFFRKTRAFCDDTLIKDYLKEKM
jgi:hypothetical protein